MNPDVVQEKQRLDNVFSLVKRMPPDDEVLAHWAKYLCVLTSGFIENSLRLILRAYTATHACEPVANFVWSQTKGLTNLNDEKIASILGAFDPNWRETFCATRSQEQKDAIDSVLANRHQIAHGRSVGLTFVRMKQYYNDICKAIKIVDEECVNK
jgi:hypothetical protein